MPHGMSGIFVSKGAVIGKNCTVFQQVTIGSNSIEGSKTYGAPTLGDNVYIGAGAKIIGGITVGDNVRIGANCVVTQNIPANSTVVLEKPRVIVREGVQNNNFRTFAE
ncbi:MAG: serine acetyltransferase [Ruminococcaceae bacterium]|nr:serine acetyltransferase [Oscillospiraceae bacterium]